MHSGYVKIINRHSHHFEDVGYLKDVDEQGTLLIKLDSEDDRIWFLPSECQEISETDYRQHNNAPEHGATPAGKSYEVARCQA